MHPFLIRAILFDFDGVLVNSEPIRFQAGAKALAEIGVPLTWEGFVKTWLGRTDEAALADILGARFGADGKRVMERRNALYEARLDDVMLFPDAAQLVRRTPLDIRLGIATGSRRVEVEGILWRAVLTESFQTLVTAEDYGRAKPAPDPFLTAARLMKVPPATCLVIEDSPAGVAAALAAGMPVVAVNRSRGDRALDGATWRVATLDQLSVTPRGEVVVQEIVQTRG